MYQDEIDVLNSEQTEQLVQEYFKVTEANVIIPYVYSLLNLPSGRIWRGREWKCTSRDGHSSQCRGVSTGIAGLHGTDLSVFDREEWRSWKEQRY